MTISFDRSRAGDWPGAGAGDGVVSHPDRASRAVMKRAGIRMRATLARLARRLKLPIQAMTAHLVGSVDIVEQPVWIIRIGLAHEGPELVRAGNMFAIAQLGGKFDRDAGHAIIIK